MKGTNELRLNTATMVEALQMWLDSKMPHGAPEVTNVVQSGNSYAPEFTVTLVEEDKQAE